MSKKILAGLLSVAIMAAAPASALAGFGSSSGGSKSFSSGSSSKSFSSPKPSSSSKSSYPSGSSKSKPSSSGGGSSSKPKFSTPSKPSTGKIQQPKPVTKLIPPTPVVPKITLGKPSTPKVAAVQKLYTGRNYGRDRSIILAHPAYADPYNRGIGRNAYYGSYDSPFYYMWLASVMGGSDRPLPPEARDGEVSQALVSFMGIIDAETQAAG